MKNIIEYIKKFFLAKLPCRHHWDIKTEIDIYGFSKDYPMGKCYVMRCKHCGDIKKEDFYF